MTGQGQKKRPDANGSRRTNEICRDGLSGWCRDEEKEEYFFSVADIVQVLTDSTDVKQYIKRMRSRDPELDSRWGTICTPTRSPTSSPRPGVV